jgi:antitoxin VapB
MVDIFHHASHTSIVALNIKNREVERLASEVAGLAGESKTEAVRRALQERRGRLAMKVIRKDRRAEILRFLEQDVWPLVPKAQTGRRLTRKEEDEILGYGRRGV